MATQKKPKAKAKAKPKKPTAKALQDVAFRKAFGIACDMLADGPKESISDVCKDKAVGISRRTFYRMLRTRDDELRHRYAQARETQADRLASDIIDISDDARGDYKLIVRKGAKGDKKSDFVVVPDGDTVQRARLRTDNRKWLAGKLKPSVYGERTTIDHTITLEALGPEELIARANQLAATLGLAAMPEKVLKLARHQSTADK